MKVKVLIYFVLLSVFIITGCEKSEVVTDVTPDVKINFSEYRLSKKINSQLKEDLPFLIQNDIMQGNGLSRYFPEVIPEFTTDAVSVTLNGQPQISGVSKLDLRKNNVYELTSAAGTKKQVTVRMIWDKQIAQLNIVTNGRVPVSSKTNYVEANFTLEGNGFYKDFQGSGEIKGRGNSTWQMPKKPYKIKLKDKTALGGMVPEKDWVLLANYLDIPFVLNAIAFKIADQLNMPFTNHAVPVEVTLNNNYIGLYTLTEQIEVKAGRVSIGNDGHLLQLDTYYDEEWKFRSSAYRLPVMVMDPAITNSSQLSEIQSEFNKMENLIASPLFPDNNYTDFFEIDAFASYFIVCLLTDNGEMMHPKSTFIHKQKTGKYTMGPVWDFDWAYGYEGTLVHFSTVTHPIFWNSNATGQRFFSNLVKDPKVKTIIKHKWSHYQNNHFLNLMQFIDDYTFLISDARDRDYQMWRRGSPNYFTDITNLKNWLQNRSAYVTNFVNGL